MKLLFPNDYIRLLIQCIRFKSSDKLWVEISRIVLRLNLLHYSEFDVFPTQKNKIRFLYM